MLSRYLLDDRSWPTTASSTSSSATHLHPGPGPAQTHRQTRKPGSSNGAGARAPNSGTARTSCCQPTCPNCSTTSLVGSATILPFALTARHGHQFHRPSSSPLRHLTFVKRHAAKRTRGDAVRLGVGNEEPAERSDDHEPSRPSREPTEHTLSPAIRLPRPVHPHPLQDLAAGSDQPGCGQIWPGSKLTTIGARRGNVAGGVLRRRAVTTAEVSAGLVALPPGWPR